MGLSEYLDTSTTKSSTRLFAFIIISVGLVLALLTGYMALHMALWPIFVNFMPIAPATTIIDSMTLLILALIGVGLGTKTWSKKYENGTIDTIDIAENKKEDK